MESNKLRIVNLYLKIGYFILVAGLVYNLYFMLMLDIINIFSISEHSIVSKYEFRNDFPGTGNISLLYCYEDSNEVLYTGELAVPESFIRNKLEIEPKINITYNKYLPEVHITDVFKIDDYSMGFFAILPFLMILLLIDFVGKRFY